MAFVIPFTPEPGPFHDVLFWLNVICLAAMAVCTFVTIDSVVGLIRAIRHGEVEVAPAEQENRATRRKKG